MAPDSGPGRALARWWGDVAVLGRGAPRRAAHELAVRTGWHGRRMAWRTSRAGRRPGRLRPPPLGPPAPVPAPAAERTQAAARRLLAGHTTVFGRTVELDLDRGPTGDWHRCPDTGAAWPADVPWWRVEVRGPDRPGDVKWVWEAARHRDLVVLARAAALGGADGAAAAAGLARLLDGWEAQVRPERGVHWLSNLEVALRSLAWLQVGALAPEVARSRAGELARARAHLDLDLGRTALSMRNNHLVGDLVALALLDRALPDAVVGTGRLDRTDRTHGLDRADALLAEHVDDQVRADGSMVEESLSYHRFVAELLALRVAAGDAPDAVRAALDRSGRWLARLGVLDGPVPQHGDWDEGRAVTSTQDPHDLAGTARLALALAGTGAPPSWRAAHDEVAWHARSGDPVDPDGAEVDGHDLGGGIARAQAGPWTTWLRASAGGWHGHADHSAVVVHHQGRVVVGDPGTGAYNGPDEERQYLRGSMAHDVLRLDGHDQLVGHRAFRWRHQAGWAVGPPLAHGGGVVSWVAHDAYARLDPPRRVVRAVLTHPDGVLVADWVLPGGGGWDLSLPLAPHSTHEGDRLALHDGTELALHLPGPARAHRGEDGPLDGWWSPTYGERRPSTRLALGGRAGPAPVAWAVARPGTGAPRASDDGGVAFAGLRVVVRGGPDGAELAVGADDGEPPRRRASLRWP